MSENVRDHDEHPASGKVQRKDSAIAEALENSSFLRLLSQTRIIILFGAFASLLSSVVLLIQSVLAVIEISWDTVAEGGIGHDAVERLSVEFLGLIDSILLGTVLYIIALGLYELFYKPDLDLPEWLRFRSLIELKAALIEVIVVLLGVLFVRRAVSWREGDEILEYGLATAAVILALGLLLVIGRRGWTDRSDSS